LTIADRDVEGNPSLAITGNTHTYDPGAKALPTTNSDRDIERMLAPGISGVAHKSLSTHRGLPPTKTDSRGQSAPTKRHDHLQMIPLILT